MVTKLITKGRSKRARHVLERPRHQVRERRPGRQAQKIAPRRRARSATPGPSARSPLMMRAPSRNREFLSVSRRRTIHAVDLGLLRAHEPRLELRIAGEVAGREHDAAARAERARPSAAVQSIAATRPCSTTSALRARRIG